jgi:hypothetical protein
VGVFEQIVKSPQFLIGWGREQTMGINARVKTERQGRYALLKFRSVNLPDNGVNEVLRLRRELGPTEIMNFEIEI